MWIKRPIKFALLLGMFYYQMPSYYNAARQHPYQQAMFVQYTQPQYPGYPTTYQARSADTNGVSTFTAGDTIAAGSILKGFYPQHSIKFYFKLITINM